MNHPKPYTSEWDQWTSQETKKNRSQNVKHYIQRQMLTKFLLLGKFQVEDKEIKDLNEGKFIDLAEYIRSNSKDCHKQIIVKHARRQQNKHHHCCTKSIYNIKFRMIEVISKSFNASICYSNISLWLVYIRRSRSKWYISLHINSCENYGLKTYVNNDAP